MRQPAAAGELCLGWEGQAEGRAQEGKISPWGWTLLASGRTRTLGHTPHLSSLLSGPL